MIRRAFTATPVFVVMLFLLAAPAFSFGGGGEGCGAGTCSECHSLTRTEAEKLLTGLVEKIHKVDFAIVPGLWKVDVESKGQRGSVLIDFSKSYAISGRVLRLSDWEDVSASAALAAKETDFSKIPLDDALVMGSREAPTKVVIFTDPQCPYCQKLHEELKKVVKQNPDVAFYLKFFPLSSHPDAYRISKSIICEKSLELLEGSLAGGPVPDPTCETDAIDQSLALARELGIRSTPTMILPGGAILSGYKPAGKILELLEKPVEGP